MVKTVTLQPVGDAAQVWQQVPNDGQAHYLKVDEGFAAQDGDATYLVSLGPAGEALTMAALPMDLKLSSQVRVRAYAKADNAGTVLGLVWYIDGVQFTDPSGGWDFSVSPLNQWVALDLVMSAFPLLHGSETIELALSCFVGAGEVRLGQVELVIDYFPHPDRFAGAGSSSSPEASGTATGSEGQATSGAPEASAAGAGSAAAGVVAAPTAVPALVYLSGDPAAQAPMATLENLSRLRATPASTAPLATAASSAPTAAGEPEPPEGSAE